MIEFILAHAVALSAVGVAVIDFLIEIHPGIEANGVVSILLSFFKKEAAPKV